MMNNTNNVTCVIMIMYCINRNQIKFKTRSGVLGGEAKNKCCCDPRETAPHGTFSLSDL